MEAGGFLGETVVSSSLPVLGGGIKGNVSREVGGCRNRAESPQHRLPWKAAFDRTRMMIIMTVSSALYLNSFLVFGETS